MTNLPILKSSTLPLALFSSLVLSCKQAEEQDGKPENDQATTSHLEHRSRPGDRDETEQEVTRFQERLTQSDVPIFLQQSLEDDPADTLRSLGAFEGAADYHLIRETLLGFFEQRGYEELIEKFHLVEGNPDIAVPLWGELLVRHWDKKPQSALQALLRQNEFSGTLNAAAMLGDRMGTAENPKASFESAFAIDTSDEIKKQLLKGIASKWVGQDFEGAFDHVSKMEPGLVLDATFYELIDAGSRVNAGDTMPWATSIQDPGLQRSAILQTAQMWATTDQDAYHQWKAGAELPDDLRKELP